MDVFRKECQADLLTHFRIVCGVNLELPSCGPEGNLVNAFRHLFRVKIIIYADIDAFILITQLPALGIGPGFQVGIQSHRLLDLIHRLEEIEFKPFQRLIDDGIPCVLVGHISLPEVTGNNTPATLSKEIVDILRNDLDFDGVAITDAMNMGAIMDYYYNADAAVMAVEAGMDILLMPPNLEHYQSALVEAVESGRISESRIDESVERILSLKFDSGLIE